MRGADKLLRRIEGTTLLRRQATAALATGLPVTVVLGQHHAKRAAEIEDLPLTHLTVSETEMSASIKTGVAALPPGPILIMLADMPEIESEDLMRLVHAAKAHPDQICRAVTEDGTPGQPALFPACLRPRLQTLTGDKGARDLIATEGYHAVELPDQRAVVDLDTPEDWAAWEARAL